MTRIAREEYVAAGPRAARVELLRRAAENASTVVLDIRTDDGPSLRQLARRALGRSTFDEESLRREIAEAGLVVVTREVDTWTLERGTAPAEDADSFRRELARVVRIVREVERRRLEDAPEATVRDFRARGGRAKKRGPIGRARLRRAIGWVDRLMRGGPNCFRRTLLELALDAGAAKEPLVFGLDVGRTGHVAFKGREDRTFDVVYEFDPE